MNAASQRWISPTFKALGQRYPGTALCVVLVWPGSAAAAYFDRIGSVVVSCYLLHCGARTVKEIRKR